MQTVLDPPGKPAVGEIEDRKSVFIGAACHVSGEAEALEFIAARREHDPKARHVCHCAIWGGDAAALTGKGKAVTGVGEGSPAGIGAGTLSEHMSDDGEPSGTAGKPILEVLRRNDMTDCIVTVTRYFGGTLLGSGGLIRAYSSAASAALSRATKARIVPACRLLVQADYPRYERLRRLVERCQGRVDDETFTDRVSLTIALPAPEVATFKASLRNSFNGRLSAQDQGLTALYQPL
ncbi:IMPACT family protein [Bifidobacterium xylocopae]|uniref:IMPACT family protein n=1 Tax=Bifidobacterium xylocopae TaxID=2493119 RepID=A0A366KCF9_9BIFI|nr:YigZ family protein [Bifidobacterium xylocopae]RBP99384.1 IMPACT family protein [Bifidobacterium xylocopae]